MKKSIILILLVFSFLGTAFSMDEKASVEDLPETPPITLKEFRLQSDPSKSWTRHLSPLKLGLGVGVIHTIYDVYSGQGIVSSIGGIAEFCSKYLGLPFLIANAFSDKLKTSVLQLGEYLLPAACMSEDKKKFLKIMDYFNKYKRRFFTISMRRTFDVLSKQIPTGAPPFYDQYSQYEKDAIDLMDCLARFPVTVKKLNREKVLARARKHLSTLSPENLVAVMDFIEKVIAESNAIKPSPCALYLKGAPGTGKTRLAKILYEFVFKIPFVERRIGDYDHSEKLFRCDDPKEPNISIFSAFLDKELNAGIFFDEFDKSFGENILVLSKVLYLFDLKRHEQICSAERSEFKHPWCPIMIATGNADLPHALASRIRTIRFAPLPMDIRLKVCKGQFKKDLVNYRVKNPPKDHNEILEKIATLSKPYEGLREMLEVLGDYAVAVSTHKKEFDPEKKYEQLKENAKAMEDYVKTE